ncbi:alpha/beta fold hydrolase [Homoserinimonas sp. A520]
MAKLGKFTSQAAGEAYLRAYDEAEKLWPAPVRTRDVETSFGHTHVHVSGEGDGVPLVLIHGLAGSGLSWHSVVAELGRGRLVYAPDNVGVAGRSVQTAPISSAADYGAWGAELLEGLGLKRAHLLGYSEGAWYAALIASHFGSRGSDRIASLTLGEGITTLVKPSPEALRRMFAAAFLPTRKRMDSFNEWLSPGVTLAPEDIALATASMKYRRHTPWPAPLSDHELRAITAPTLALFGAETRLGNPVAAGARIADNIRDTRVELIPGGGHGLLWQLRADVLPLISEFLREKSR